MGHSDSDDRGVMGESSGTTWSPMVLKTKLWRKTWMMRKHVTYMKGTEKIWEGRVVVVGPGGRGGQPRATLVADGGVAATRRRRRRRRCSPR